jgi:hypothetical protein
LLIHLVEGLRAMANANNITGLTPINQNGTPWSGQGMLAYVPPAIAVNVFRGDPVVALGGSDAFGCPAVGPAAMGAGNPILGAMLGISNGPSGSGSTVTRDLPIYRQASIPNYILICDDVEQLYIAQEDSVGGAITAALGAMANANLSNIGGGNTFTGASGVQIQSSSVAAAANPTYQVRLLGLLRGPGNNLGVNADWVVKLNNPQLFGTAGV